jgi:uncharacterized protein (TIGR03435 family)
MASHKIAVVALLTVIGLFKSSLRAQSGAPPQFEVASIKPSPSTNAQRAPMSTDPARIAYNSFSPKILLQIAYKMPEWGIAGGPNWLDSDRYDVAAKIPPGASSDQVPVMLQALLAERFHLSIRRETRQLPVYELTIAKNGPRLKPGETGEQWAGAVMKGGILKGRIELHQLTMPGLAEVLASKTGRPVIDMTRLKGAFDISLTWTPDDTPVSGSNAGDPSLYTAIREQLGLRLDAAKASVEVIVITHIERPSEN